jgi:hypothetical protein
VARLRSGGIADSKLPVCALNLVQIAVTDSFISDCRTVSQLSLAF